MSHDLPSPPAPPTLTLWVGTVSGKVAAYGVNIVPERKGEAKNQRKIELIPTSTYVQVFSGKFGDSDR